jgi:cytochrome c oxidase cbb3-type subunit 3
MDSNKLDHNYDGIEELDNQLPRWWLNTFYGTIVFAALYFAYYMAGPGPSPVDEFQKDWQNHQNAELARQNGQGPQVSESELNALSQDPNVCKKGREIYTSKCASCHGPEGQGGIGPNMTDSYWLHGAKLSEIFLVVNKGVPEKGMPPWGSILKENEMKEVVAYIKSIHGSTPPNAKSPQGELIK